MNNLASSEASPPPIPLADLILSLEQATLMAKQLPSTTDPNHLLQIYSSLHQAQHHLSSFIPQTQFPLFPHPPFQAAAPENSLSSATGAGMAAAEEDGNEPMQVGDDDYKAGTEENSKATIDEVEEKMRDYFITNKRAKRPLSPSSVAEERRLVGNVDGVAVKGFDPHGTRLRALDLIYQFHG